MILFKLPYLAVKGVLHILYVVLKAVFKSVIKGVAFFAILFSIYGIGERWYRSLFAGDAGSVITAFLVPTLITCAIYKLPFVIAKVVQLVRK